MKLAIALVIAILAFLAVQVGLSQTLPGAPVTSSPPLKGESAGLWTPTPRSFAFGPGWSTGEGRMGGLYGDP